MAGVRKRPASGMPFKSEGCRAARPGEYGDSPFVPVELPSSFRLRGSVCTSDLMHPRTIIQLCIVKRTLTLDLHGDLISPKQFVTQLPPKPLSARTAFSLVISETNAARPITAKGGRGAGKMRTSKHRLLGFLLDTSS